MLFFVSKVYYVLSLFTKFLKERASPVSQYNNDSISFIPSPLAGLHYGERENVLRTCQI